MLFLVIFEIGTFGTSDCLFHCVPINFLLVSLLNAIFTRNFVCSIVTHFVLFCCY